MASSSASAAAAAAAAASSASSSLAASSPAAITASGHTIIFQGAEGRVFRAAYGDRVAVVKERFSKKYRHPKLDEALTKQRMTMEVRMLERSRGLGVAVPAVLFVDLRSNSIWMEEIVGATHMKEFLASSRNDATAGYSPAAIALCRKVGELIARLHCGGVVHGDLTPSNILLRGGAGAGAAAGWTQPEDWDQAVVVIDFGLSSPTRSVEDRAVDLYVLERALRATHADCEPLVDAIVEGYSGFSAKCAATVKRLEKDVRQRGRKRSMLG